MVPHCRVRAELAHKDHLDNSASYKVAKHGAAKFLPDTVNETWYNNLKDTDTFYTKVLALKIMIFLDSNRGGLHTINMISLHTNMHQYYVQADGIPQYIVMLEGAQKKTKRMGMPIAKIKLVMMALAAVLVAQHFPCKVDNWEGLPSSSRTWVAWKMVFHLAHLKGQCQTLASGGGEPLGRTHGVLPEVAPPIGRLEMALNNLALAATNDMAILQQLTTTNLALMTTVIMLTATNTKFVDAAAREKGGGTMAVISANQARGIWAMRTPFPSNFC